MRIHLFLILAVSLGCSSLESESGDVIDDIDASFGGKSDSLVEGSAAACAALRVANEASFDALDIDAGLDARAAHGIVDRRPFATLVELDAVPYVGNAVLARLVEFANDQNIACAGEDLILRGRVAAPVPVHDEWMSGHVLAYTFFGRPGGDYGIRANGPGANNDPVVTIVGPLSNPFAMPASPSSLPVVATFGPNPSVTQLTGSFQVPSVGVYLMLLEEAQVRTGFIDFQLEFPGWTAASSGCYEVGHCDCSVDSDCGDGAICRVLNLDPPTDGDSTFVPGKCTPILPGSYEHADCRETGGVYRTVVFTAEEACAALDVLNHAPWSVLRTELLGWAFTAFYQGPGESGFSRVSRWRSLAQFARQTVEFGNVGSSTLNKLKSRARTWSDNGEPVSDTVASIWNNRFALDGAAVAIDEALVTEVLPMRILDPANVEWVQWCSVVRDQVGATNFLRVCTQGECLGTVCQSPMEGLIGKRAFVSGVLEFSQQDGWSIGGIPRPIDN